MKVKDKFIQVQQKELELDLSYQEWLRDNFNEPSEEEMIMMEKEFYKPFSVNKIISLKPLNNKTYNPLKGA